jgi:thiol-disulfide isomerase/thioredoxin
MIESTARAPGPSDAGPGDIIETLTADTFDARVGKGEGPIVVEFMSYGCGHCRVLEPILQRVAETLKGRERIYGVDVAVEQELAARYAIGGTPTLVMFLGGTEVARVEGPPPSESRLLAAVTAPFDA